VNFDIQILLVYFIHKVTFITQLVFFQTPSTFQHKFKKNFSGFLNRVYELWVIVLEKVVLIFGLC
jgi:hypothetical protein